MNVIFFWTFQYRIHIRTTDWWKHLGYYVVPVTILSLFFNIPMFINLQVIIYCNMYYVYNKKCISYPKFRAYCIHCLPNTATQIGVVHKLCRLKTTIFDPRPPLLSFLLTGIYLLNLLCRYPTPSPTKMT